MFEKIKFKGQSYILVGGALTTKEDYENGRVSFAHLFPDGSIKRFNKLIGTKKDITFTGKKVKADIKVTVGDLLNNIDGWLPPMFL